MPSPAYLKKHQNTDEKRGFGLWHFHSRHIHRISQACYHIYGCAPTIHKQIGTHAKHRWSWLHPLSLLSSPPRVPFWQLYCLIGLLNDLAFKQDCRQTKKHQERGKQNYVAKRFWPRFTLWFRHLARRANDMNSRTRDRQNVHCKLVFTPFHLVVSTPGP